MPEKHSESRESQPKMGRLQSAHWKQWVTIDQGGTSSPSGGIYQYFIYKIVGLENPVLKPFSEWWVNVERAYLSAARVWGRTAEVVRRQSLSTPQTGTESHIATALWLRSVSCVT